MKRCIIHIGMHKTGSTSIQESLRGFSDARFLYPELRSAANHSLAIYSLFATRGDRHHLHRASGRDAAAVRAYNRVIESDLEEAIRAAQGRTLLISGEDISVLPKVDLLKLREYFQPHFDELVIVGYVRPPAGFLASGFQQRVKGGSVARFNVEQVYHNYKNRFVKFDDVFGRENVHLWKFDPKTFPGGCVVQDFCSRLDISFPAKRIVRLNESLSRQAVALLYAYRKLAPEHGFRAMKGAETHRLGAVLAEAGNDRFRFSPDVTRPILEKHRADIEWMEGRLGQSLYEDLGGHQPGDVRDESDLLDPDPDVVSKLLGLLGDAAPEGVRGATPEEVALLVHALREKQRYGGKAHRKEIQVNMADLLEELGRSSPGLLEGVPVNRAEALVRSAFRQINETLAETEEGVVNCLGLGQFRVRKMNNEVGGRKPGGTRIGFYRAERRAAGKAGKRHDARGDREER
ncbi:MAG: hypothetical protein A3G24_09155 [Betaproteobacteria bacterium RIFCSPLOWO2_12_FULL_62_13]|nr:MAG: hypothetical protein A3G24_09155 [Betaproteobacteria bacterium RIFCSPLOWO2_12_FULL_62_13]